MRDLRERFERLVALQSILMTELMRVLAQRAAMRTEGLQITPALLTQSQRIARDLVVLKRDFAQLQLDWIDQTQSAPLESLFSGVIVPDNMPEYLT